MKAIDGQNIFDIVVSETKNINNLFPILFKNNLNVDDIVQSGQNIDIPKIATNNETFIITTNNTLLNDYYIQSQQNIYDLTCQHYGDMSFLFDFINDNSFDFDTILQTGQKIILHNANKGNEKIKKDVNLRHLVFANQGDVLRYKTRKRKSFSLAFSKSFD